MQRFTYFIYSPLALLGLWELASQLHWADPRFFPPPSGILHYLFFQGIADQLHLELWASLKRILAGFSIGTITAIVTAVCMFLYRPVHYSVYPIVFMTYPLPKIAILPLIMLIFGIGELSKIVVVAIGSFFLVLMSTLHGIKQLSPLYFDVASVYQFGIRKKIFDIILPGSLPAIFNGLKLALGYSLVIVVAAEFSGADSGIGYIIWQSWEVFSIKTMYAGIFIIAVTGLSFALLIDYLEKRFVPWSAGK